MDDTQSLTIVDSDPRAIGTFTQEYAPVWSVDLAIAQWLDAKEKRTQSARTRHAYAETVKAFRAALQSQGLDLDSVATQEDKRTMQLTRDRVKQLAQLFAGFSKRGGQVKQATVNHRYAVLSSFYGFCIKQEWLDYNPIEHLERAKVEPYSDHKSLDFEDVAAMFEKFDMSKAEDVRDAALLAIALQTGRRVSELAALQWKHVSIHRGIATLFFERCKGNKSASDELDTLASKALLRWLHTRYGAQLGKLPGDTPLWVSLARGKSKGQKLSIQAIGQICKKHTGTAHVHRLRNTFAMGMLESGATLREVSGKLLHSSLATTSGYVDKLQSAKNTLWMVNVSSFIPTIIHHYPCMTEAFRIVENRLQDNSSYSELGLNGDINMSTTQEFIRYTPEQLAHILKMLLDSRLDAWIINAHTDEPIVPEQIKQSGMVYVQIGEKRFPCYTVVQGEE